MSCRKLDSTSYLNVNLIEKLFLYLPKLIVGSVHKAMLKINSSLRILGLAAVGTIAAASQANALTEPVIFVGAKNAECTVDSVSPGTLNLDNSGATEVMEATAGIGSVTGTKVGTPGTLVVSCTANSLVAVAPPVQVTAPGSFAPVTSQSVVELDGTTSNTSAKLGPDNIAGWGGVSTTALPIASGTPQTLNVGMAVQGATGSAMPDGAYEYTVSVTIASN